MIKVFHLMLIVLLLAGCGQTGNQEQQEANGTDREQLYDEVIAVHDEVMPKMQTIMNLKEQLRQKIDSLAADTVANQAQLEKVRSLTEALDQADEAMMSWMRGFKRDYGEMTEEEIMDYLNQEKEKIEQVAEQTETAIREAREYDLY